MNNELYFKCLQLASGNYLSANLPSNWYDWTEEQQNEFLLRTTGNRLRIIRLNMYGVVLNQQPK